jgi:hypothetical protein
MELSFRKERKLSRQFSIASEIDPGLLGLELDTLLKEHADLSQRAGVAHARAIQCRELVRNAERSDETAAIAAVRDGKQDPGRPNVEKAQQVLADAERESRVTNGAVDQCVEEVRSKLAAESKPLTEKLSGIMDETATEIFNTLAALDEYLEKFRGLKVVREWVKLARNPESPVPVELTHREELVGYLGRAISDYRATERRETAHAQQVAQRERVVAVLPSERQEAAA